jgi:PTH1 family peptidyl-tRNA hydrolase
MVIVIALGNPEPEYAGTRHNVAREALDRLADDVKSRGGTVEEWRTDKLKKAAWTRARLDTTMMTLVRPTTYMNHSGEAVRRFLESPEDRESLIIVHDEFDMPLGSVKIAYARGAGGHNGVQSVIDHLGNRDFARIRIGIAPKGEDGRATRDPHKSGADYVLDSFGESERVVLDESLKKAVDMILSIAKIGVSESMNRYN